MAILSTPVDLRATGDGGMMTYVDGGTGATYPSLARLYYEDIDRDVSTYGYSTCATLKAANYISTDNFDDGFTHYFMCIPETTVNASWVWVWGVAYVPDGHDDPNLDLNYIDTHEGSYLAVGIIPLTTDALLRINYCRLGAAGTLTTVYTIPARYLYHPLYCKVVWAPTATGGTLTLTVYEDPARTVQLATGSTTLNSPGATITGLDRFYCMSSHNTTSTGYHENGWSGEFYLETTPPAMFTTYSSAIPLNWDTVDSLVDFHTDAELTWTESVPAGTTLEEANFPGTAVHSAHLIGDGAHAFPLMYAPTSVNVWKAGCVQGTISVHAVTASHTVPLFGLSNNAADTTTMGYYAFVYASATPKYYIRLAVYVPDGASPGWLYSAAAVDTATVSSYANQITLDTEYDVLICHSTNSAADNSWVYLYIKDITNSGQWKCVDSLKINASSSSVSWTNYDWTMNHICVGQQGTLSAPDGECYVKDIKFHDGAAFGPALARGGTGDTRLMYSYIRREIHGGDGPYEFMVSDDDGLTFDALGSIDEVAWSNRRLCWDATNSQWLITLLHHITGNIPDQSNMYTVANSLVDATMIASKDISTHKVALGSTVDHAFHWSRMIEGGYALAGGGVSDTQQSLIKVNLSDGSLTSCVIARRKDIISDDDYVSEAFVWRRQSDDNLMALVRWDDADATPRRTWFSVHTCQDGPTDTNEGMNFQVGNATSYEQYKLVVSGADFTTTDGVNRLKAVTAGWTVRNTTLGTVGYVKTGGVAATKLSIVDAAGVDLELFPDEGAGAQNDAFEITCWGKPVDPAPAEEYNNKGGNLCAYPFAGYLYITGYCNDPYWPAGSGVGPYVTWVARASDSNLSISCERTFWACGARTPADDKLEPGNGDIEAAIQSGNHYLDWCSDVGVAMYMRLDAVDTLAPTLLGTWNGVSTSILRYNGITADHEWNGAQWSA